MTERLALGGEQPDRFQRLKRRKLPFIQTTITVAFLTGHVTAVRRLGGLVASMTKR